MFFQNNQTCEVIVLAGITLSKYPMHGSVVINIEELALRYVLQPFDALFFFLLFTLTYKLNSTLCLGKVGLSKRHLGKEALVIACSRGL